MLQVKLKDFLLRTPSGDITDKFSVSYREPGFTQMFPLELEFPKSDQVGIYIRKRADDTGDNLSAISKSTMTITVLDPTNGQIVPYTTSDYATNYIELDIVNALNLSSTNAIVRVRVMDVNITDSTDDDFITFRVLVDDDDRLLNYILVDTNNMVERNSVGSKGGDIYVSTKSGSDNYLLFSPYATIKETTSDKADFSYPLNTIFYKRQESYNNEDYSYSISLYSHAFARDTVSVMNVPGYHKAGVLLIDNKIYTDIVENGVNPYIDIAVVGELSGYSDTFRIHFTA